MNHNTNKQTLSIYKISTYILIKTRTALKNQSESETIFKQISTRITAPADNTKKNQVMKSTDNPINLNFRSNTIIGFY